MSRYVILRIYVSIVTALYSILNVDCSANPSNDSRVVFPSDFVKFTCRKSLDYKSVIDGRDRCTWTFLSDNSVEGSNNSTLIQETDCVQTKRDNTTTKLHDLFYEGYVHIPKRATAILCGVNETLSNVQKLSVQEVELAEPLTRYLDYSQPTIVLQRFSNDYAVRLGVHDVTNQTVSIDGDEIESITLLCISPNSILWTNYTISKRTVMHHLSSRDKEWLNSKTEKESKLWKEYISLVQQDEMHSTNGFEFDYTTDQKIQVLPLLIRTLSKNSSRTYKCHENNNVLKTHEESVFVTLKVQSTRIGPDEIQLIQQIAALIDGLSKGERKEPWSTLITILGIVLILFAYYCKKKLDQSPPQHQKPPEETEMNTSRRESRAQAQGQPVASAVNETPTDSFERVIL